ncbi:hypothetical protein [Sulfurimonas sp.]|nr:hypothetical protein [Sulfurimonas sp.]
MAKFFDVMIKLMDKGIAMTWVTHEMEFTKKGVHRVMFRGYSI